MEVFKRKRNRLPREHYRTHSWFFVTTCVAARQPVLVGELAGALVEGTSQAAERMGFTVYAYCVMPDHFHLLVYPTGDGTDLISFVSAIKQATGYAFRQRTRRKLWQKSFYDHVLRKDENENAVAHYIWMNPVRKGLCEQPQEWPWSGSFGVDWPRCINPVQESWLPPWKRSGTLQGSTSVTGGITSQC